MGYMTYAKRRIDELNLQSYNLGQPSLCLPGPDNTLLLPAGSWLAPTGCYPSSLMVNV